jgi:L-asparaginase II
MSEILVKATRGGYEESFHRGSIPVVDLRGKLLDSVGDPDLSYFLPPTPKLERSGSS